MFNHFKFTNDSFVYAFRILLGCGIVWLTLNYLHDSKMTWALISVIIVSDSNFEAIRQSMFSRIINTLTGCALGLVFISVFGIHILSILGAITTSVLLGTTFKKYPTSWKLAPVTVLIVMVPGLNIHEHVKDALIYALDRTAEVLYGSFVAFILGFVFTLISPKYKVNIDELAEKWKGMTDDGHE